MLPEFIQNPNPKLLLGDDYVVADFETTNIDKGSALARNNRIILATWIQSTVRGSGPEPNLQPHVHSQFDDEFHQKGLLEAIESTGFVVAHHSKFELQWLARCGAEIGSFLVWDTMLGEFIIAGNRKFDLSLDGTAKRYGLQGKRSLVSTLIASGICPSVIPEGWLLEYCSQDTILCQQIFLRQREEIVRLGLLAEMYTACLLTPVLADIETRGLRLDARKVNEEYYKVAAEFEHQLRILREYSGETNFSSPVQVSGLLYETLGFKELVRGGKAVKTASGRACTGADTIELLVSHNRRQSDFKEAFKAYKKAEKKLQNLEKLKACCDESNGHLFVQYNQAVAGTHRLTSTGRRYKVQGQNIDHTLKPLFTAQSSSLVGEADAVQLEFRIAAHLGRDSVALADIRDPGFDVHWQTAEAMANQSRTELTKDHRYEAKPYTFRPLYGGMSGTPEQKRYIKFFQERYAGIYETQTEWTRTVLRTKKLRTETGLIFYWPDTKLEETRDGRGYIRNRTAIFNYPVQFLATGVIIPVALIYFWHRAKAQGLKLFVVNTVHDSIICELPEEEKDDFRNLANLCFTVDCCNYLNTVYNVDLVCPLGCATKVASHWGEGEEIKYEYDPTKGHTASSRDSLPKVREHGHRRSVR